LGAYIKGGKKCWVLAMARRNGGLEWRPTKIMNMHDLSNDDDFLSHLLVEKLGTGTVPLYVHKMDPTRRLPKTDAAQLLDIVRRVRSPHTLLAVLCSHSSARSIQEHSSERCPARDRRPPPVGLVLLLPLLTLTPPVSLQSAIISSPTPRSKSTPLLRMSFVHLPSQPLTPIQPCLPLLWTLQPLRFHRNRSHLSLLTQDRQVWALHPCHSPARPWHRHHRAQGFHGQSHRPGGQGPQKGQFPLRRYQAWL